MVRRSIDALPDLDLMAQGPADLGFVVEVLDLELEAARDRLEAACPHGD
jgi:hypothetical protein